MLVQLFAQYDEEKSPLWKRALKCQFKAKLMSLKMVHTSRVVNMG